MRNFKRYTNRKLYDVENSCYITIPEILNLHLSGIEVLIKSHVNGQDVTAEVLMRAVCSLAETKPEVSKVFLQMMKDAKLVLMGSELQNV